MTEMLCKRCYTILGVCVLSFVLGSYSEETVKSFPDDVEEDHEVFIPTNEWQEVKPGQAIPSGLHVRMDMTNGGKWAKLMDKAELSTTNIQTVQDTEGQSDGIASSKIDRSYSVEQLKQALKKMKEQKKKTTEHQSEEVVRSKFRSMEEIRKSFEALDLQQETDVEVMQRLTETLRRDTDPDVKLMALKDLEYYVHQVDNAVDLFEIDGFGVVVQSLNSTEAAIREEAAHVIGSAVQSNPKVQIKALESSALVELVRLLHHEQQPESVKKKALFAISALVRHFPFAQTKFGAAGGFNLLANLLHNNASQQLQMKAIRLVNDLMEERHSAASSREEKIMQRMEQYSQLPLSKHIRDLGFCSNVANALNSSAHDVRETILTAMKNLYSACSTEFSSAKTQEHLQTLQAEYTTLVEEELREGETDGYYSILLKLVESVIRLQRINVSKDEL